MINSGSMNPEWFIGIVEHVEARGGRVKVRCYGFHPFDSTLVSKEDLPWAYIINNNFNRQFNWPEVGMLVFGFFMDGRDAQRPMVLGSIVGDMHTSLPSNVAGIASFDKNDFSSVAGDYPVCQAYGDLRSTGLNHNQAIGVLANIHRESGFATGVVEGGGGGGIGLFQYTYPSRKAAFVEAVPDWQTNAVGQVRYAITTDELGVRYASETKGYSAVEAANWFTRVFENPRADIKASYINGGGNARLVEQYEAQVAECSVSEGVVQ